MHNDKYRNFCLWLSGYISGLKYCEIPGIKTYIDTIDKELNQVLCDYSYLSSYPVYSIDGICPHKKASNECNICNGPLCEHHFPVNECDKCDDQKLNEMLEKARCKLSDKNPPNHVPGTYGPIVLGPSLEKRYYDMEFRPHEHDFGFGSQ